mmetsp:Transcript_11181/g.35337  ORF Transcript_11181/g.35337 Transcript_11181/m.35337 type:complete len:301 (-) Transcript_11181:1703-2605(-)
MEARPTCEVAQPQLKLASHCALGLSNSRPPTSGLPSVECSRAAAAPLVPNAQTRLTVACGSNERWRRSQQVSTSLHSSSLPILREASSRTKAPKCCGVEPSKRRRTSFGMPSMRAGGSRRVPTCWKTVAILARSWSEMSFRVMPAVSSSTVRSAVPVSPCDACSQQPFHRAHANRARSLLMKPRDVRSASRQSTSSSAVRALPRMPPLSAEVTSAQPSMVMWRESGLFLMSACTILSAKGAGRANPTTAIEWDATTIAWGSLSASAFGLRQMVLAALCTSGARYVEKASACISCDWCSAV